MQKLITQEESISSKIYTIRGVQVMLDRDLAKLYGVSTKVFNQAIKRNSDRFPEDFKFQLSDAEFSNWRSQFVTSNGDKMGLRHAPYVFTEQGISMLSGILKSDVAIAMNIKIIRLFVAMRHSISPQLLLENRVQLLEKQQEETLKNMNNILNAMEAKGLQVEEGIFYDGVDVTIYTQSISKTLRVDVEKYNTQYKEIEIKVFKKSHDRFIILDENEVYHIGASLKDLGKKWFAFSKMSLDSLSILKKVEK